MYYLVKYKGSKNVYLMRDKENGKGVIEVLQCIYNYSGFNYNPGDLIIPLDLQGQGIEYVSGERDEILGLAALEAL